MRWLLLWAITTFIAIVFAVTKTGNALLFIIAAYTLISVCIMYTVYSSITRTERLSGSQMGAHVKTWGKVEEAIEILVNSMNTIASHQERDDGTLIDLRNKLVTLKNQNATLYERMLDVVRSNNKLDERLKALAKDQEELHKELLLLREERLKALAKDQEELHKELLLLREEHYKAHERTLKGKRTRREKQDGQKS